MKQIYFFIIFYAASSLLNAAQINFLSSDFYGFEDGGTAFWIQHSEWNISTERAADGTTYSLKYSSESALTDAKKAHGGKNGSSISLEAGTYTLKMKVWIEANAEVTAFDFALKEPWSNHTIDISSLKREEWVEVSKTLTLTEDAIDAESVISVKTNYEGKGTFYIDEIQIWGEGEEIVDPEYMPLNSSIKTIDDAKLSLPQGVYNMTVKVLTEDNTSISKFYTQIDEPWLTNEWEIKDLESNQWAELTQELIVDKDIDNASFSVFVSNHPDFGGGKGAFYIDEILFEFEEELGTETITKLNVRVYPNPVRDLLSIESDQEVSVKMYNLHGQLLKATSTTSTRHRINVSDLKQGMYLLQVKSDKDSVVKKVNVR
ncbi:T9SS type A sorting domain-containing protein [Saccharicrinis aurantiacus]|uniref:T9SS type A sorting domain-containing protein n=1 Tax=Saccharicrinis aurantiacus TaxID=1849719 RepID=UPI0024902EAF|nr:T9SS type A sorting domain-containing protein [Saccharicrinis aurantiacus]